MKTLDEFQTDVLTELVNLGMGLAASALCEMIGEEIALSVPDISLVSRDVAVDAIAGGRETVVVAVQQGFSGPFNGSAILVFPEDKSLNLVRALMHDEAPLRQLTDLEEEVLAEIGNVLINACLSALGDALEEEICTALPSFCKGMCNDVLAGGVHKSDDELVLLLRVEFNASGRDVRGYVLIALEVEPLEALISRIEDGFRAQLTAP